METDHTRRGTVFSLGETTDELELRYATAGALAGTTNRLYADCNSGFEVRNCSVPTVQSGYTITH